MEQALASPLADRERRRELGHLQGGPGEGGTPEAGGAEQGKLLQAVEQGQKQRGCRDGEHGYSKK